jgi:hypothetical protein
MKNRYFFFAVILFCFPFSGFAWSLEGHRICGEIASRHLSKKTASAVASILGDESIAMASNWADFIKSDTAYKYLEPWHYIDIKDSLTADQVKVLLQSDTATDAYVKIQFLSTQLKNKSLPHDQQAMYLKLLIHIVEDIHQPLHTIDRGRGGNDIKIMWFNDASNLHSLWDGTLIRFQDLSYTEYANALDHASKTEIKTWQSQPLSQWIYDSYVIGEKLVNEIKEPNQKLSYRYNFDHLATMNQQLLKGGIDLAKVLNDIFG